MEASGPESSTRPAGLYIVDAHLDLGYHCQEYARDLVDPRGVGCMVTLPLLLRTGVRLICATLFVPHINPPQLRREALERQWELYSGWLERYGDALRLIRGRADLAALARDRRPVELGGERGLPVGLLLLMEGCELLASPAELERWHARGLRMASLTWNGSNRYASGSFSDGGGLTPAGRELLAEFTRLGVILDQSHLSDAATSEAFACYNGPICASHSNSRSVALSERNLLDSQAQEIGRRGGVIGLNLLASFVHSGWKDGDPQPPLSEACEHVEYLCGLAGPQCVGIGSDLDGGLTPLNTPVGIERIDHLHLLLDELQRSGWGEERVRQFAGANWWSFFERALPA